MPAPAALQTEFCSGAYVEQQVQDLVQADDQGRALCDVRALHRRFMHECAAAENLTGPHSLILEVS